jgi:shikimate kinase
MRTDFLLPPPPFPQRLYLTGFMGSGKSTAAKSLAGQLGFTFIDLDRLVAVLAGRPIADLFAEGEAAFRAAERETLERTFDRPQIVVATGGGALAAPGAMEAAQAVGRVVYLRLPAEVLIARLEADPAPRPLLQDAHGQPLRGGALRARVEALLAERTPRYEQADVVIDADGLTSKEIALVALHALDALRPPPSA